MDSNAIKAKFGGTDEYGNTTVVRNNGDIWLYLKNGTPRNIGNIRVEDDGTPVFSKFMKASNVFRKSNSWGFSAFVLGMLPDYAIILVKTDTGKVMSVKAGLAKTLGEKYMSSGFERQILVPISAFTNA